MPNGSEIMPTTLWTRFINLASAIGCDPADVGEMRLQKTLLVALAFMIAGLLPSGG